MKRKMLLLASIAATLLSSVLLIAPANAVGFICTDCSGIDSNGHKVKANCQVQPIDSCFCPLSGTITQNNCRPIAW